MNNPFLLPMAVFLVFLVSGCATPVPPAEPSAMVPKVLTARIPTGTSIYVEKPALDSAAKEAKAPFDEIAGAFPFVQPQGLANYQEGIRLTLAAAGAPSNADREKAGYTLRTVILGGMAIPFPEAYSVLFVHYQLEDSRTGRILWATNTYSQAKLEKANRQVTDGSGADPGYGRLAVANLRQMVDSLAAWIAGKHD